MSTGAITPWDKLGKPKQSAGGPPPEARQASASAITPFSQLGKPANRSSISGPPTEENAPQESPGWTGYLTQSVAKTTFGKGISEFYDRGVKNFNEASPDHKPGYGTRLTEGILRMVPEAADMATSPAGMLLMAGHLFPVTLPIATAVDVLIGGYQLFRTIPSVVEAVHDPEDPDKVANAVKDMAFTLGAFKTTRNILGKPEWSGKLDRPIEAKNIIARLSQADPDQKIQIINELMKNNTLKEKTRSTLYNMPLARTAASILDVRKPKILESAAYLVDERDSFIELGKLEAGKLRAEFKREVPTEEQHVTKMGYVMENSATPEEVKLSEVGKGWISKIRDWNKNVVAMYQDPGAYGPDVKLHDPETYLMHTWGFENEGDLAAKSPRLAYGRRMMRDPQLQRRTVGTYREGIEELGYKPAVENVGDLLYKRHIIAVTAIANQKMVNVLNKMGLIVAEDETHSKVDPATGKRSASHYGSWPSMESRPLERAAYVGKTPKGQPLFQKRPVRVHPDIALPLEAVMGESYKLRDPASGRMTPLGAIEALRGFGKQQAIGFSFFHHWAISEQGEAIALGNAGYELTPEGKPKPVNPAIQGARKIGAATRATFFANPELGKGMKSGIFEVLGKPQKASLPPILGLKFSAAKEWISAGAHFGTADAEGPTVDAMRGFKVDDSIHPKMASIVNNTFGKALHGVGNLHYVINRGLWDYFLPSQWMNSAEMIFTKEMNLKPRNTREEIDALRYEIAKHVNKVFGTESMTSMMMSPKARFIANFAIFAPVWTFSNLRVLSNGFQTETGRRLTGRWLGGAMFAWFTTTTLANYATTGWVYSGTDGPAADKNGVHRAHGPWDNPGAPMSMVGAKTTGLTENWHYIYTGHNPDGTESYIRFGKGYFEPLSLGADPIDFLANKMGLLPKAAIALITKHEPGSGYEVVDRNLSTKDQMVQYGIVMSETVAPYVLQDALRWAERKGFPELVPETGSTQATIPAGPVKIPVGLPTRKGFSASRAVDAYQEVEEDKSLTEEARRALIQQIFKAAEANHIPLKSITTGYKDRLRKKQRVARGPKMQYDMYGNVQQPPENRQ